MDDMNSNNEHYPACLSIAGQPGYKPGPLINADKFHFQLILYVNYIYYFKCPNRLSHVRQDARILGGMVRRRGVVLVGLVDVR